MIENCDADNESEEDDDYEKDDETNDDVELGQSTIDFLLAVVRAAKQDVFGMSKSDFLNILSNTRADVDNKDAEIDDESDD